MREVNQEFEYVLDPHTAVGYYAARNNPNVIGKKRKSWSLLPLIPPSFPTRCKRRRAPVLTRRSRR